MGRAKLFLVCLALNAACALSYASPDPTSSLSVQYTGDVIGNAKGGLKQGARFLQKFELILDTTGNFPGAGEVRFFADAGFLNGAHVSGDLVGDDQGVSNIEAFRGLDIFQLWMSKDFASKSITVTLGLLDANVFFDNQNVAALFLNSSHGVGPEFSLSGVAGPSIFPLVSLGTVVEKQFNAESAQHAKLSLGIFDGVPGNPVRPDKFDVRLRRGDGVLLVVQGEKWLFEGASLQGGAWIYTAPQETFDVEDGVARRSHGDAGAYARIEGPVRVRLGEAAKSTGWIRLGLANSRFNAINKYVGAGIVVSEFSTTRKDDALGLSLARAGYGRAYRKSDAAPELSSAAETTLELAYRANFNGFYLQPDMQLVLNPGGNRAVRNSLTLGLRLAIQRGLKAW